MAAGLGLKTFVTGDVLTAADTNGYLMQGVWVFADAAARTAAVTSPQEGNMSYLKDTNSVQYYSGSAWTAVAAANTLTGVGVTKSATQSIATATYTAVTWDQEGWDTDSYHDNVTNNSRITIPSGKGGKYLVTTNITYAAAGGGGYRLVNIYKNGAGTGDNSFTPSASFNTTVIVSKVFDLAVADYIQVYTAQDSGGALNVQASSSHGTSLQVTYLGA
jgi:hypothetical protein